MKKTYTRSLFIFRRDLRLEDNLGLLNLLAQSETVVPAFIFDPRQADRPNVTYFRESAFQVLLNSLAELHEALRARGSKLYVFYGDPATVTKSLIEKDGIDGVCVNKDYTPFARKRDRAIAEMCQQTGVVFEHHNDLTLSPIEIIKTKQDKYYTVFTPFLKNARTHEVQKPRRNNFSNYFNKTLKTKTVKLTDFHAELGDMQLMLQGGRSEALKMMRNPAFFKHYKNRRNLPADEQALQNSQPTINMAQYRFAKAIT